MLRFARNDTRSLTRKLTQRVSKEIKLKLSDAQLKRYHEDGFLCLPKLIESETVQKLREIYDQFLNHEIDAGEQDGMLGGLTRQIMKPSAHHAYFRDNLAIAKAREIAQQLLESEAINFQFDMLISKPPGNTNQTPWHQDGAYSAMPFAPAGTTLPNSYLQFWVALDDADEANGCMQFIPGAHGGALLEHFVAGGESTDPRRILQTAQVDASQAVACPLRAGGCTVHAITTPHFTGGNFTPDRNRRAYIFNLMKPLEGEK